MIRFKMVTANMARASKMSELAGLAALGNSKETSALKDKIRPLT